MNRQDLEGRDYRITRLETDAETQQVFLDLCQEASEEYDGQYHDAMKEYDPGSLQPDVYDYSDVEEPYHLAPQIIMTGIEYEVHRVAWNCISMKIRCSSHYDEMKAEYPKMWEAIEMASKLYESDSMLRMTMLEGLVVKPMWKFKRDTEVALKVLHAKMRGLNMHDLAGLSDS